MLVRYWTHRLFGTLVISLTHLIDITALADSAQNACQLKQYVEYNLMTPFSLKIQKKVDNLFYEVPIDEEIESGTTITVE